MLVLSRQRDETIMIGDNIEITVVDIRGDRVRLGIAAPREVQVHRKEVYQAIKRGPASEGDAAGNYTNTIEISTRDLERLAAPKPHNGSARRLAE